MSENLSAAAAALDAPEVVVQRSAEARAKASGASVDEILAAWAGGGTAPAAAAPPAAEAPAEEAPEAPAEAPAPEAPTPAPAAPAPTAPAAATPEVAPAVTPVPTPESVSPEEAMAYPVVVSVPTAGIKERTGGALPGWLVALFMIVPAFGLLYLAGSDNAAGECQPDQLELAVDRATGALENCDGSEFEGRGGAAGAAGAIVAAGGEAYRDAAINCAGCHGANGQGGTGPAFANVTVTFSSCEDHVEWVRLGSAGFQGAGRTTYGDVAKPIAGGMPGFPSLSEEELRAVVAFERISYGGADAEETLADCGLVEPAAEDTEDGEVAPADEPEGDARLGATG